MDSYLKYYSVSKAPLSGAYGDSIGHDCTPVSITICFYSGREIKIEPASYSKKELYQEILKDKFTTLFSPIRGIRWVKCDSGIIQEPSSDLWVLACANSRLTKTDLVLQNGIGVIDPDYRGTIRFIYHTTVPSYSLDWLEYLVKSCGQLVLVPRVANANIQQVEAASDLTSTERGSGGFGSTNF